MAARSPRKLFATPFVVTLAAMPIAACVESTPPPQQPTPTVQPQPTAPPTTPTPTQETTPPTETVVTNPPRPTPATPAQPEAFSYEQHWTVTQSPQGCSAMPKVDCPKPEKGKPVATCNPPPPMKYECPKDWTGAYPIAVVQYANDPTCQVERAPIKCPQGALCNPPPPTYVACPKR
jgi:hypothetical protein